MVGANKNLDEQLVSKQTDISSENKLKVKIRQLEQEVDKLRMQQKYRKRDGSS